MNTREKEIVLDLTTRTDRLVIVSFVDKKPKPYEMESGFELVYRKGNDVITADCIDDDHVYRSLKEIGIKKSVIKVVLKQL